MAVRRSRLLYTLVAAVTLTLWWQYGRQARTPQLSSPLSASKPGPEVRPIEIMETKPNEAHQYGGRPDLTQSQEISSPVHTGIPSGSPPVIPQVQFPFPQYGAGESRGQEKRKAAVREAFIHSWNGYKKHAWLKDELGPLTGGHRETLCGWAVSLIDSLDTLWIMGLEDEFHEAVNAAMTIDFRVPSALPINVFEVTIRLLGGFLGAYDISGAMYPILLEKAQEIGEMLYGAFDTPNKLPIMRWYKLNGEVPSVDTVVAEIGSLTLEFTRLSQLTGDPKYFDAVQRILSLLSDQQMKTEIPGLFPMTVNVHEADFTSGMIFTIGGQADSLYEYLPKEYLMLGVESSTYKRMYVNAFAAIKDFILFRPMVPTHEDILLAGTVRPSSSSKLELDPQMQHLSCFAPGMIALASKIFDRPADLELAARLAKGCLWAGRATTTGIMPELFHAVKCPGGLEDACPWHEEVWAEDMFRRNTNDYQSGDKWLSKQERLKVKQARLRLSPGVSAIASRQYFLRPEVIESVFVMYRITGNEYWREEAWSLYQAITNAARTDIAFAGVEDVSSNRTRHIDRMESFWLAETLKYFYLIFSDPGVVSLDDYVFNTEAHPFKRPE